MAARWLGGTDCAEDLVQDAMLKLWAMCAELRSPMAPLARVLVHNLCIDYLLKCDSPYSFGAHAGSYGHAKVTIIIRYK